ncbi:Carboxylic ester hydrolase [Mycena venus]|uniref:Carboxylic ester hydrolase n=1 Tax=Mycena venus TaxID=2733690 RepID=A0A8H7CUM2_9AGAR|nr:Carboxylic ester hydrolase [Mycena venus]
MRPPFPRQTTSVSVSTSSGVLQGTETNGILTFKGIRFGQAPTGSLRWAPPVAFTSTASQNATTLGPACVQQFPFAVAAINEQLFNTPPPPESEDCLFLNVWAPASTGQALPVVIWIYGGALAFGTASIAEYDGASLASNQSVVVVSFNYRTNVFGFPESPDLPLAGNNLGFLDQELAFQWVQTNIANFGGDPKKVTIMGQSAGAASVAAAYVRHATGTAPFQGAIMLSGTVESTFPTPSFTNFNTMASAVGCNQSPGAARLACLRAVPASTIRTFTNSNSSGTWGGLVDNVTLFSDPLLRIQNGQTSKVPFMIGHTENDGSLFALNQNNLTTYLSNTFGTLVTPNQVRALYANGLSDNAVIAEVIKDFLFLCPAELWGAAAVSAGTTNVYRYAYGAVFSDLQLFANAGAWHSSELFEIFGTYPSDATAAEKTLSLTMENIVANFARNPAAAPAPNWPKYVPGNTTNTLAKLAYNSNVALSNVVQTAGSNSLDSPCDTLWNQFLDVRV